MVNALFQDLAALPQVEAIALGGSRAGRHYDEKSDYDVYLYCTASVPEEIRRDILAGYCGRMELGNHFWELEDNCTLNNGIDIDLLYRDLDSFASDVASVVESCQARNGYTTCMWHNLMTCRILYDEKGRLAAARKRFSVPYPEELRANILNRNLRLLQDNLPSYDSQIRKAAARGDSISVNHRVCAFLESYFDILFALNRRTHPGEKRLMTLCRETCPLLPEYFEENLHRLFGDMFANPRMLADDISLILMELKKIL